MNKRCNRQECKRYKSEIVRQCNLCKNQTFFSLCDKCSINKCCVCCKSLEKDEFELLSNIQVIGVSGCKTRLTKENS